MKYLGIVLLASIAGLSCNPPDPKEQIVSFEVNTKKQSLQFFWKDDKGENLRSIFRVKNLVESRKQKLRFAMNAGMFEEDRSPTGLYIEKNQQLKPLNSDTGKGNFYLSPSGVFYITQDNIAGITSTEALKKKDIALAYATQSGPMLVHNGKIHSAFHKESQNKAIRNGVGVLPNGNTLFAITMEPMNFYDFSEYFLKLGCKNALFLDGIVSKMYLPEKGQMATDGDFGVIIALVE